MTDTINQTPAEIIEKNKMIANFMGWIHSKHEDMDKWEMENLKYHTSWSALMPVIEKISKLPLLLSDGTKCTDPIDTCYPITFNMPDEEGNVMFRFKGGYLSKSPNLIDAAYNAVVDFIEWDNKKSLSLLDIGE